AKGKDSLYFSTVHTGFHCFEQGTHAVIDNKLGNGNGLTDYKGELYYYATTGIYLFDASSHRLNPEVMLPEKFQEWGSCVLRDSENNFWIGTHEKLLQAKRKIFSDRIQPMMEEFDEVYCMRQLKNGDLLCATNRGKVFVKKPGGVSFTFRKKLFAQAPVSDILEDDEGDIWFGSFYQGIGRIRKEKAEVFSKKDGLRDNTNLFFLVTRTKELFTGGDAGITKIIRGQDGQVSFKNYLFTTGNHYSVFNSGIQQPDGRLLFGSNFGLIELRDDSLRPVSIANAPRKNIFVTDIKLDAGGLAWISTMGDGILVCSFQKDGTLHLVTRLNENDGLASSIYLELLIDHHQLVWAVGHAGISRIEKQPAGSYFINNFDQTHGYINDSYHSVKMLEDNSGYIWIATSSGLFNFNPTDATQMDHSPSVAFSKILNENNQTRLAGYTTEMNPETSLPYYPSHPYYVNDLYFEFNTVYLTDPSSVKYVYRLIGSDSNWVNSGNTRSVTFRNLPPGNYSFEVKSSTGSNRWSEIARYQFLIQQPFWTRLWFISLVVLVLAILVIVIMRRREKNIRRQEEEKIEFQKLKASSYQYNLEIEQVTHFFSNSISNQKTVDDILWDVARNCISKLGFEDCVIYLKDEKRNVLVQQAAWGPKTTDENKILNPIEIPLGKGIVGSVAESGKALIVNDTSIDERYIVDDERRNSEISVPIFRGGEVTGVIDCEHSQKNFYNKKHLQILTTIASLCADRIDRVIAEQETREKEIEVFKLNQNLATSQLTALRSQMNPHFIFNSLNSIAQLIASKQNEEGLEYLTKFSRLLRLVLEGSGQDLISMKDEIKMLELYLQLESLRFDGSFNYAIHVDDDLDEEEVLLPSFLIHPVVENAIWHGLLHKAGERRLIIEFTKKTKDQLHCIIKDNGIGINSAPGAKKAEQKDDIQHASKGLQLVSGRLDLLQQQHGIDTYMITQDMNDVERYGTGTKVTIQLPLIYE
ncbi:MAG: sensor histidine kinase, partial [Flavitalea sp.]